MKASDNDYMNNTSPEFPKTSKLKAYVICAAIWFKDGKVHVHQPRNVDKGLVVAGRRHHNCYLTAFELGEQSTYEKLDNIQGFITSDDRFLDRAEAGKLAFESRQIEKLSPCLFSEDLY